MNLRELEYILKVAELRNVTRAAEELHIGTEQVYTWC